MRMKFYYNLSFQKSIGFDQKYFSYPIIRSQRITIDFAFHFVIVISKSIVIWKWVWLQLKEFCKNKFFTNQACWEWKKFKSHLRNLSIFNHFTEVLERKSLSVQTISPKTKNTKSLSLWNQSQSCSQPLAN